MVRARRTPAILLLAAFVPLLAPAPSPAALGPGQGLIVLPRPASGAASSYFKLTLSPGALTRAGSVEVSNTGSVAVHIALAPVAGETIGTLGSTYAPMKSRLAGSASWLQLPTRTVELGPHASASVPLAVLAPATAKPGDYLAGVSVEALEQDSVKSSKHGVSIASAVRYVLGVETFLPGPRHPLIQFTGARLERQPAGLAFLLLARNPGNVILKNVEGSALITQGGRTVAHVPLGPGTFVTATHIAYPVPTPREHPSEGTQFRVRAYLRYAGGVARLDTLVRFGHLDAVRQQAYTRASAKRGSGMPVWLVAFLGTLAGGLLVLAVSLLLIRRRSALRSPARALEAALLDARTRDQPLVVILITPGPGAPGPRKLAALARARIRPTDQMCQLGEDRLLVLVPDTDRDTADSLAADLERHLSRALGGTGGVSFEVREAPPEASAAQLMQALRDDLVAVPHAG